MKFDTLKEKEIFLFDMDGTIYVENQLIDGALELLNTLKDNNKKYIFLTNNSSKNVTTYLEKLRVLNITASVENMFTSSQATALYLKDSFKNPRVYCVGTNDFRQELKEYGIEVVNEDHIDYNVDCVVVGFDTELNYKKITVACELISSGKPFIATNMDLVCPVKGGKFIPDCGAICNMIKEAVGVEPKYIGKPNKDMVEIISTKFNISKDKMVVIGDRLYTDIAIGVNADIDSICVLTGETKVSDIEISEIKPTFVMESVKDILDIIK